MKENKAKLAVLSARTSICGKGKLSFGLARFRSLRRMGRYGCVWTIGT